MTLQIFKSNFLAKSEASRESMRRATFIPPYHHISGRPFETYNPATPNSPKRGLKTLEKLARGAQAKIFRASEGKICSGNTVRCLLKAVFLPHSEQESPRIHIKQRLKQQKTAPQALWRSRGEKTREQIQGVKRKKNAFRSSVAPRTSLVTILRYVPREYMTGNSKTRKSTLNGPVVDREARGEIPKKPMYAIPKIVMIKSN